MAGCCANERLPIHVSGDVDVEPLGLGARKVVLHPPSMWDDSSNEFFVVMVGAVCALHLCLVVCESKWLFSLLVA